MKKFNRKLVDTEAETITSGKVSAYFKIEEKSTIHCSETFKVYSKKRLATDCKLFLLWEFQCQLREFWNN